MKNKKTTIIVIVTIITTSFALFMFWGMFFFLGFLNPIIFGGTAPLLLLISCVQKGEKRYVIGCWLVISIFLMIVTSIIAFTMGSPMFNGW